MNRVILVVSFILLVVTAIADPMTDDLRLALDTAGVDEFVRVNIRLSEQYDSQSLLHATRGMSRDDRRAFVIAELQAFSATEQAPLLQRLAEWETAGRVNRVRGMWLSNVICCEATPDVVRTLAVEPGIERIDIDEERQLLDPRERRDRQVEFSAPDSREITWNVTHVNADDVWSQGYTGSGVLVAVIDTGVNYNHQDLANHVWNGGTSYPYHGYDFYNDDNNPMDDDGHGTHCAGTVAGDGTAGSQTGMAPDATIMALKVLSSSGSGYESDVWDAIQFAVTNGADIISLSLGWQHAWGPDRSTWRDEFVNALTAGLVAAVAAGNEGDDQGDYPIPDNVRTPGDCPPPWLHPDQTLTGGISAVVCVGASDSSDNIAYFSSLGPCTWSGITGYNDYASGIQLIRPDVNAPGVSIKSLDYSSNTGYESGWNGTSMATPCVAGIMALMLSKDITLTPAAIDQYLETNSVPQTANKSNTYGSGRVDALATINAIPAGTDPPNAAINPNPTAGATDIIPPDRLAWSNGGGATSYTVYAGTNNGAPWTLLDGVTATTPWVNVSGLLYDQQYFWKVDSHNAYGDALGSVWNFTTASAPDEDFESGDFSLYPWSFTGDAGWNVVGDESYSGSHSAVSADITHYQDAGLSLNMDVLSAGSITFARRVSSESGYDYLRFYIDGSLQDQWAGEVSWGLVTYPVNAGNRTFEWIFEKDGSVSNGSDCAWIDFIFLPPHGAPEPNISVSPLTLSFGDVNVGGYHTLDINIMNTGSAPLNGDITTPTGYSVAEGRNTGRNVLNYNVAAGDDQDFHITFAPPSTGAFNGTVVVSSNDPDTPTTNVSVSGIGVAPPDIDVTPASFSLALLPDQTYADAMDIANTGTADLHYTADINYTRHSRDILVQSGFEDSVPPAGWTSEILVGSDDWDQSATSYSGSYSARANWQDVYDARLITPEFAATGDCQLSYWIRSQDTPQYGGDFDIEVSVSGGDWSSFATYNQDSFTQTFTQYTHDLSSYDGQQIRVAFRAWNNYWNNGVYLDEVNITGTSIPTGWVTLDGQQSVNGIVSGAGADNIAVGFDSAGLDYDTYLADIVITSDDPDEPSVTVPVTLIVTNGTPQIVVTPASLNFGQVLVGQSQQMQLFIDNPGTAMLTGTITTPTDFSIAPDRSATSDRTNDSRRETKDSDTRQVQRNILSLSIPAGYSEMYWVSFEPATGATYSDNIVVSHNAGADELVSVTGEGLAPVIVVSPNSVYSMQEVDTLTTHTVVVSNTGTAPLNWTSQQQQGRGQGGPDAFGYTWIDSNEPDGPVYNWEEITVSGTELALTDDDYEEIALPFSFPFYGVEQTSVKIGSNGYLTFGIDGTNYSHDPIPDTNNPNDFIAPFWDDLKPIGDQGTYDWGSVYYEIDGVNERLIVQYDNVAHYHSTTPSYFETFEVIIYSDGSILFQYESLMLTDESTVGIENPDGTDGLQIAYFQNYLAEGLAVRIEPPGEDVTWLSHTPDEGTLQPGEQQIVTLTFDSAGLSLGQYSTNLLFSSDDPVQPNLLAPVTLDVEFMPDPPTNLHIEIVGDDLILTWDAVPGATMYTLYYSEDGIQFLYLLDTPDITFTIYDIGPLDYVYFYVTAQ
ncbi:MAG: S8 family serine peptidase [Candidatus Cloacimonetes bacterium]|nr:S8 family serine peptidase [Candidatus Cloacimonadota bacterium]